MIKPMGAEDIAKVIYAASTTMGLDESYSWDLADPITKQLMEHGVRVVQEGGNEKELARQYTAAMNRGGGLERTGEEVWRVSPPELRRLWVMFVAITNALSNEAAWIDG